MILLVDLLVTIVVYLLFPVLYVLIKGKTPAKKARKLSIINVVIAAIVFEVFQFLIFGNDPTYVPSFLPAFLYYHISKAILESNSMEAPSSIKSYHYIDDEECEKDECEEETDLFEEPMDTEDGFILVNPEKSVDSMESDMDSIKNIEVSDIQAEEAFMKIGDYICARTHAEFLNQVLDKQYKAFMKSSIKLSDGKLLWMMDFGDFVTSAGFKNKLVGRDKISEKHVGDDFVYERHNTYVGAIVNNKTWDDSDRVVFDVVKGSLSRKYVFRGVFRLNKDESTLKENVWDLISDKYKI